MILVLSTVRDEHAVAVMAELDRRGVPARILDLSEFPRQLALVMQYDGSGRRFRFGCDEAGLDLGDCGAVWWRRPQSPEVSDRITRPSHRLFAQNESAEALQGLWHALDAFWMNDPGRDAVAHRKAYQLRVAQDVGLEIPETLVTNCPGAVKTFVAERAPGQVICKSFSATEHEWRETRLLKPDELDVLDNVRYAPVIFQAYVPAEVDLRVTVVGDQVFPAAIHSQETEYPVDFRIDIQNARIERTSLPAEVETRLHALMERLGIVYGAIDMRRTPDGRHVFLEVNPAGQWLFVEHASGLPITAAMAETLAARDTAGR